MKILWDEPKRLANLAKHGMDFADLTEDFFVTALIRPSRKKRWMSIGPNAEGVISVVFASLGSEGISLISMRPASTRERKDYAES